MHNLKQKNFLIFILFIVVFLLIYILSIICIPLIAKNKKQNDFVEIYSVKEVDDETFSAMYSHMSYPRKTYIDFESDKINEYQKWKRAGISLYLSLYSIEDIDDFDCNLFDGFFIKCNDALEIIKKINSLNAKTKIDLLVYNLDDITFYKNNVDNIIIHNSISSNLNENNSNYCFYYEGNNQNDFHNSLLDCLNLRKRTNTEYGFVFYLINS